MKSGHAVKQHRLPATAIASFAYEQNATRRDSKVYSRRRYQGSSNTRSSRVGTLTVQNRVYDFKELFFKEKILQTLELKWHPYEQRLGALVESLVARAATEDEVRVKPHDGLSTLIPYLAGTLVRGQDFDARRVKGPHVTVDNTNLVRISAWQQAQASLMRCAFTLIANEQHDIRPFIVNDLGYSISSARLFQSEDIWPWFGENLCLLFPLTPNLLLVAVRHQDESSYRLTNAHFDSAPRFFSLPVLHCVDDAIINAINTAASAYCWQEVYASSLPTLQDLPLAHERPTNLFLPGLVLDPEEEYRRETTLWQTEVQRHGLGQEVIIVPDVWFDGGHTGMNANYTP